MATINQTIAHADHDSDEIANGTIGLNDTTITLTAGGHWGLLYWPAIGLPTGATVTVATVDVYVVNTSNDDPNVVFYVNDVDSAAAPSASSNDISGRALTTASTAWNASNVGEGYETIDILTAFQEWAARPGVGVASNFAVVIDSLAGSKLQIVAYDSNPARAAVLNVTYTVAGGGGKPHYAYAQQ